MPVFFKNRDSRRIVNSVTLNGFSILRYAYIGAIVLGVLGISVGMLIDLNFITVLAPLVTMSAYVAFGLIYDKTNRISLQFADSIYYLGFLFTLIALLASLLGMANQVFAVKAFAANFALALITTVAGLVCRTLIASFMPNTQEVAARAELSLAHAASGLQGNIERLNARLLSIQEHFVNVLTNTGQSLDSEISSLVKALEKQLSSAIKGMSDEMQTQTRGMQQTTQEQWDAALDRIDSMEKEFANRMDTFGQTVGELLQHLSNTEIPQDAITTRITPALEALRATLEQCNTAWNEISAEQARTVDAIAAFNNAFVQPTNDTIQAFNRFKELTANNGALSIVEESLMQVGVSLDDLNGKIRSTGDGTLLHLGESLTRASASINEFEQRLKKQNQGESSQVPTQNETNISNQINNSSGV